MTAINPQQLLNRWQHLSIGQILRRLLPLVATFVIIWWLLRQSGIAAIWAMLIQVKLTWFLVGLGFYLFTNGCRAYRFAGLLSWDGLRKPRKLVPDMIALSFLNNILPARIGELLFPALLYKRHHVPVAESLTALLLARLFDFLAVAALFLFFAFWVGRELTAMAQQTIFAVVGLLTFILLLLILLPWVGRKSLMLVVWLTHRFIGADNLHVQVILQIGERAVTTAELIYQGGRFFKTLAWSCLGWLGTFAWFYAFLAALGLQMPYPAVVVGSTFATLSKAIPFATIGGFGLHEVGWAFGFNLMGVAWETAVMSGFAVNILTLLASLIFVIGIFFVGKLGGSRVLFG